MGLKARFVKKMLSTVGKRDFQQLIDKEEQLTQVTNTYQSVEDSPKRFEIVFEAIEYPADKLKLFSSLRTMKKIPSIIRNITKSLTSINNNPKEPKDMINDDFLQRFEEYAKSLNVASVGYTKLPSKLIFKEKAVLNNNAIVLTMEMDREKIEQAPSDKTATMIMKTYDELGKASNKLTEFIREHGYSAQAGHPLGGLVLYPPLAESADLGYRGKHGLIITPEHGSRVRLTAIYTNIQNLPFAEKNQYTKVQEFCEKCFRCVRKCPGFAIRDYPIQNENGLLTHIINKNCFPVFLEYHGCSICLKECPFSRVKYSKLMKQFNTQSLDPDLV
ncbi:[Fe-S]-binding protein [Candidatus Heimdallarchaeota archaeon B3_Heim]|nr:MAG: [Fe-S]-binding protein [Candidatus Heimdallarchaeota archaeon B3_Heim]